MEHSITYGLTHLAVAVKDLERTLHFYQHVFDMEIMYHQKGFLQLTTPGCHDIMVFIEKKYEVTGNSGSIEHFGFRLRDPGDIDRISKKVIDAGGIITEKGEFVPGSPFVFFKDLDGYEIEVWFEVVS